MQFSKRDFLCSRIMSGLIILDDYVISSPTAEIKYRANLLYNDLHNLLKYEFTYDDQDILKLLIENRLWTKKEEDKYKGAPKDIEDAKVKLYQSYFRSNEKKACRDFLKTIERDYNNLSNKRHQYDHLLLENILLIAKNSYILLNSTTLNNEPLSEEKLNFVLDGWVKNRITEKEYRELARTEPWRSIWGCSLKDNLFGIPAINYSEEQKSLVFWSKLYDNIYENSECPPEEIINDDDALDGWLIIQRRKRDKEAQLGMAEKLIGKHGDADEIFVMVDNAEDAKKIHELNDTRAKMVKQQKMDALKKHGRVPDIMMPDMQEKLSKAIVEKQRQRT